MGKLFDGCIVPPCTQNDTKYTENPYFGKGTPAYEHFKAKADERDVLHESMKGTYMITKNTHSFYYTGKRDLLGQKLTKNSKSYEMGDSIEVVSVSNDNIMGEPIYILHLKDGKMIKGTDAEKMLDYGFEATLDEKTTINDAKFYIIVGGLLVTGIIAYNFFKK